MNNLDEPIEAIADKGYIKTEDMGKCLENGNVVWKCGKCNTRYRSSGTHSLRNTFKIEGYDVDAHPVDNQDGHYL